MYLLFFFNDTPTTEIYTLSLHDALPILKPRTLMSRSNRKTCVSIPSAPRVFRSEEHTSELLSRRDLVCRLLLEKKKQIITDLSLLRKIDRSATSWGTLGGTSQ